MERRLVHKLPHHRRNLVAVNRSYNSDGIGAKIKSPLPHGLRNADKLIVKLLCGIKAVADACEIQNHYCILLAIISRMCYTLIVSTA